jgi:hypothetical protein
MAIDLGRVIRRAQLLGGPQDLNWIVPDGSLQRWPEQVAFGSNYESEHERHWVYVLIGDPDATEVRYRFAPDISPAVQRAKERGEW